MDVQRTLTRRDLGVAAGLALVATGSGCAVGGSGEAPPSDAARPSVSASPAEVAQRAGGAVPEAPEGIQLPNGRRVGVRPVGTTSNGLLDVPSNIDEAGWWSGGSMVGDPFGSTLIAAHVDSFTQGLGPFASLLSARAGQKVYLWSAQLVQTYVVHSLRLRPRDVIGPKSWLHSPDGDRRLTLVTCAGPYDAGKGGYQNLAVITAEPYGKVRKRP